MLNNSIYMVLPSHQGRRGGPGNLGVQIGVIPVTTIPVAQLGSLFLIPTALNSEVLETNEMAPYHSSPIYEASSLMWPKCSQDHPAPLHRLGMTKSTPRPLLLPMLSPF
jgi:hypothetical protein